MIETKNEKTFSDLEFSVHANHADGIQARLDLGNGFEISVVSMKDKEKQFSLEKKQNKLETKQFSLEKEQNKVETKLYEIEKEQNVLNKKL